MDEKKIAEDEIVFDEIVFDEIVFDESVCSAEFAEGCTETVADQDE